jgi:colanic acid/amylovoran biosynthesis glycosyltransferase
VRIAYFTNQYPAPSHTFIRREIRAIEALGQTVFRYALRPGEGLVEPEDKEEDRQTRYILRSGATEIVRCCAGILLARPLALCRAVGLTVKIGRRSDRGILRHLAYVVEAAVLASWCRQNNVQHIHAHFGTNSAAVAMLAWRMSGIPYSFTVHGPEEFDRAPFIALAEKIRHCTFVVAISSYGRSQLYRWVAQRYWGKVKVVHCGIELKVFDAAKDLATPSRRFVCIARFSQQKGHLLLVEAACRLAKRGKDFELVLCGDGELRGAIEALIIRYNLQTKVHLLGWVDDMQVQAEVLNARALVLPSFAEGLPVVIIEAMALGRPIISTFIAGIPELVISGESGWLVPAGDIEALVAAMQTCLDASVETLARMGKSAQSRALLHHNVSTEAAKLVHLFGDVAGTRYTSHGELQKDAPVEHKASH